MLRNAPWRVGGHAHHLDALGLALCQVHLVKAGAAHHHKAHAPRGQSVNHLGERAVVVVGCQARVCWAARRPPTVRSSTHLLVQLVVHKAAHRVVPLCQWRGVARQARLDHLTGWWEGGSGARGGQACARRRPRSRCTHLDLAAHARRAQRLLQELAHILRRAEHHQPQGRSHRCGCCRGHGRRATERLRRRSSGRRSREARTRPANPASHRARPLPHLPGQSLAAVSESARARARAHWLATQTCRRCSQSAPPSQPTRKRA